MVMGIPGCLFDLLKEERRAVTTAAQPLTIATKLTCTVHARSQAGERSRTRIVCNVYFLRRVISSAVLLF